MGLFWFSGLSTTEGLLYIAFLFSISYAYMTLPYTRRNYPPGPKPLPLIGNALQIPKDNHESAFAEWSKQYGDVMHLRVFGQSMVILNSLQAARDLLDTRGSVYSDRPQFVLLELMGWKHASTNTRYGPRFRKHRRFINQVFNQREMPSFRHLREKETVTLVEDMASDPASYVDHFRRYAAAIILKITYGRDILSVDDPVIRLVARAATLTIESGSPAASLVDFFPIMRHIPTWAPFSTFKVNALEARKAVQAMMDVPFERVKADLRSGVAIPSYTSTLLNSHVDPDGCIAPEDEEDIKGSAGTLFLAAEDTTLAVMTSFVLAMVLHPEEFRKAQEEMDRVVGTQRFPNSDDRPSLPYLECILKEVVRWCPPVPLGMPHRLMEDDIYRDFYIPEGAMVLVNIYSILWDCAEPEKFRPQRYLDDQEGLPDPTNLIFGFGRRICPGRHLADCSVWAVFSSLVAAFDITAPVDDAGIKVDPPLEFKHGIVRHPKPFKCAIKPRSLKLAELVKQAREEQQLCPISHAQPRF